MVISNHAAYLLSGLSASGSTGQFLDTRAALNVAYLTLQSVGASANVTLQASHDSTGWVDVATYTAQTGVTATAQIAGYYPYVRGIVNFAYSGAAGTGQPLMHYHPLE